MKYHREGVHLLPAGENQAWTTSNYCPPPHSSLRTHTSPLPLLQHGGRGVPPWSGTIPHSATDLVPSHLFWPPRGTIFLISGVFHGSPVAGSFSLWTCSTHSHPKKNYLNLTLPSPSSYHCRSGLTLSKCLIRIKYVYCPTDSQGIHPWLHLFWLPYPSFHQDHSHQGHRCPDTHHSPWELFILHWLDLSAAFIIVYYVLLYHYCRTVLAGSPPSFLAALPLVPFLEALPTLREGVNILKNYPLALFSSSLSAGQQHSWLWL